MITKFTSFRRTLFYKNPYNKCYNEMEDRGIAVFGCCCGVTGGDKNTEYLSESCIGCPFLVICQ